jgi:hypothetical protein
MKKLKQKIMQSLELGEAYTKVVDKLVKDISYLEKANADEAIIHIAYGNLVYACMQDVVYRFAIELDGYYQSHSGYGRGCIYTKEEFNEC